MRNAGKRKTELKVKAPPFFIGGTPIPAGKKTRLELPVARAVSGTMLTMPVIVARGRTEGPCIWVNAAIHGNELNGVPIIHDLLREIDAKTLRGTLITVPTVNVFGLITESRYLPDGRDLNRSFPGSRRGSLARRMAHLFMEEIVDKCVAGLDLHTGGAGRTNLPQVRGDLDDPKVATLAQAFGAPVTIHASVRDGSLRMAARQQEIPVLVYETGEAGRFDSRGIRLGLNGTLRIMAQLGMLPEAHPPAPGPTQFSRSSTWMRSQRSGFCQMRVELGDPVEAGDEVAVIFDNLTKSDSSLKASTSGIVIGHATSATVHKGDAVAHIAELEA